MSDARPASGTEIVFQWRKWDGSPHWRHECVYLGADAWGDWVGQPSGWHSARPGAEFFAASPNVTLVPRQGDFALTVNRRHPKGMRVYIDLGWDIGWSDDPLLVTGIDMDLDVIRVESERGTWVDDRDEWAEHSAQYGYPREVMSTLEELALDLEQRVRDRVAPFDDATADPWLDRLEALGLARPL
jgi:protein associated with RNAse G/E